MPCRWPNRLLRPSVPFLLVVRFCWHRTGQDHCAAVGNPSCIVLPDLKKVSYENRCCNRIRAATVFLNSPWLGVPRAEHNVIKSFRVGIPPRSRFSGWPKFP